MPLKENLATGFGTLAALTMPVKQYKKIKKYLIFESSYFYNYMDASIMLYYLFLLKQLKQLLGEFRHL